MGVFYLSKLTVCGRRSIRLRLFNKEEVIDKAKEYNVKFIRLQFTDIFGSLKNIAVTVEELERALEGRVMFDSSVIEGFAGSKENDIYLYPDPSTFQIFPWRPRDGAVARLLCDIRSPGGKQYPGCSRSTLKTVVKKASDMGFQFRVGADIEFFLFHTDSQGKPTTVTHDQAGYCDLTPVDLGENARRDMVLTLEEMGFEISSSHHELAPGQHEISIKEDTITNIADKIATFKFVVRTVAQRHGLHASFMPKPVGGLNGSGMKLHQTLWQHPERNAFDDSGAEWGLSELALYFMGGILKHACSMTALANPLVNSYKRLIPDGLSPIQVAWSEQDRRTVIRVPAQRGEGTRVVLRSPDPTCNPYLVLAVMLEAGLRGIEYKIKPTLCPDDPCCGETKAALEMAILPRSLGQALQEMEGDAIIKKALGEYIFQRYMDTKKREWERFQVTVHQWELDEYLTNY